MYWSKRERFEYRVYFINNLFKGEELRYHKIERLALAIIITARKLRPYFQGHQVVVKMNYHIRQILKKPYPEVRMVSWSVELIHYDINYTPRGSIKSQVLVVFLDEFGSLVNMEVPYVWTLSVYGPSTLKGSDA